MSIDLKAIEKRYSRATEGPWAIWHDLDHQGFKTVGDAQSYAEVVSDGFTEESNPTAHVYTDADAEFIAHAREDVPALVARVRELEAAVERVREYGEKMRKANGMSWCSIHGTAVLRALEGATDE